ncbi:type II secretion system protein [Bacillus tuaregi]|uniref:type II secretion system protein n=1 Tax=Bacillus tuaregi TaxID=1816695 RepID=UPI0008F82826|nr:type II secretion system protein [Bacillus tuaregi]
MNNDRGFTLLEILASVLILGIVLTVFFQYFVFAQRATTSNEDQLVAMNLAEKVLERMVNTGTGEGYLSDIRKNVTFPIPADNYEEIGKGNCNGASNCENRYQFSVKNQEYEVKLAVYPEHDNLGIYPVEVQVYGADDKLISKVKGLVEL